ncbi:MAG TPA: hypothetical protein VGI40_20650, partial [Pirellulaceae bacterium]
MDAYEQLRNQAAQKRDAAILLARKEYRNSLRRIDDLRNSLCGAQPVRKRSHCRPLIELMIESLPRDRAFTFSDVLESMEALESSRTFNETSVRTLLPKLETQGIIRRVSKNQAGRVEWAVAGITISESPYGAMALT